MMNVLKLKGIISLLLIVLFVMVVFTGIGLYFSPSGKIAKETSWNFLGFKKEQLENLHTLTGFLMSALVVVHLSLNYKMLLSEIKMLKGR